MVYQAGSITLLCITVSCLTTALGYQQSIASLLTTNFIPTTTTNSAGSFTAFKATGSTNSSNNSTTAAAFISQANETTFNVTSPYDGEIHKSSTMGRTAISLSASPPTATAASATLRPGAISPSIVTSPSVDIKSTVSTSETSYSEGIKSSEMDTTMQLGTSTKTIATLSSTSLRSYASVTTTDPITVTNSSTAIAVSSIPSQPSVKDNHTTIIKSNSSRRQASADSTGPTPTLSSTQESHTTINHQGSLPSSLYTTTTAFPSSSAVTGHTTFTIPSSTLSVLNTTITPSEPPSESTITVTEPSSTKHEHNSTNTSSTLSSTMASNITAATPGSTERSLSSTTTAHYTTDIEPSTTYPELGTTAVATPERMSTTNTIRSMQTRRENFTTISPSPSVTVPAIPSDNPDLQMVVYGGASGWSLPRLQICISCSKQSDETEPARCYEVYDITGTSDEPTSKNNSYIWSAKQNYRSACEALYIVWTVQFLIDGQWGYKENGRFHSEPKYESEDSRFRKVDTVVHHCGSQKALYIFTTWGMADLENITCGPLFYTTTQSPISFSPNRFSSLGSMPFSITYNPETTKARPGVSDTAPHHGINKGDVTLIVCYTLGVVLAVTIATACIVKRQAANRKRKYRGLMTFDDMDELLFEVSNPNTGGNHTNQGAPGHRLFETNPLFELVDNPGSTPPMYSFSGEVEDVSPRHGGSADE